MQKGNYHEIFLLRRQPHRGRLRYIRQKVHRKCTCRKLSVLFEKISGHDVYNFGKCGFNSTTYLDFVNLGGVSEKGADIIIIMLGTNGGIDISEQNKGYKDYLSILNHFEKTEPQDKIVLCTPPHATENPEYSNCGYMGQIKDASVAVKQIAREKALPLIDVFGYAEICEENVPKYQANDGLHFVEEGYKLLAEFIYGELKKLFSDIF